MFNEFDLKILKYIDIVRDKVNGKKNYSVGNIEFYPTEECNLNCEYCTFKDRDRNTFPYNKIAECMAMIRPASVIISGGGDPSCYESEEKNIVDVVKLIRQVLPSVKIALITNGQKTIPGDWVQDLEWLRVSIDAGNPQTFKALKGGDLQLSLDSIVAYLKSGCKSLGIGYVFNDCNVSEIPEFTWLIYKLITDNFGEEYYNRVFLEFRPTCKIESCNCPSPRYVDDQIRTSDKKQPWPKILKHIHNSLFNHIDSNYIAFIKNRSNLNENGVLSYSNARMDFDRCYYCLIKMIIYPSGDCYPCVQKSAVRNCSLGNILYDSMEQIVENQQKCSSGVFVCDDFASCCNVISQKNAILMHYLSETDLPNIENIRWNDFF